MANNVQTYLTELREIVLGMGITMQKKRQLYSDIVAIGSDKIGYLVRYSKKLTVDHASRSSGLSGIIVGGRTFVCCR